jgi:Tfp pilus assembly pilus retraction ATPase PilT
MLQSVLNTIENDPLVSDLHLSTNEYIAYRRNGDIVRMEKGEKMSVEQLQQIIMELM